MKQLVLDRKDVSLFLICLFVEICFFYYDAKVLCKMRSYAHYRSISFKKCSKEPRHGVVFVLSVTLQTIKFHEIQCFWKWKMPFDFLCTKYANSKQPIKVVLGISVFNVFL